MVNLQKSEMQTGLSATRLAMLCLKKLLKSKSLVMLEENNIAYNPNAATARIYPYLTREEQITLRAFRCCYVVSISYLMAIAIEKYLRAIVRILRRNLKTGKASLQCHNYIRFLVWFSGLNENLKHVHRRIVFSSNQIAGYTTILLKKRKL